MTIDTKKSPYIEGFSALYYLIIIADGVISEKEIHMGKLMCDHEKFDYDAFEKLIAQYKTMDHQNIMNNCVRVLSNYPYEYQVKCLAWMMKIANADGFMAPEEWKLIYCIYKKELNLNQQDIINLQRELPKLF